MKELTKEMYEQLGVTSMLRPDAKIENVDFKNDRLDYWVRKLSQAIWDVGKEEKNYIDILLLYAKAVKITTKDAVVVAQAVVNAQREVSTETSEWRIGDDIHQNLNDIDFEINEINCKEWLENLAQARTYSEEKGREYKLETQLKEFDITTLTKDNLPNCKRCHGAGTIHCGQCDGTGKIVCDRCDGTGTIMYQAGNYADGSERLKSKDCPQCGGAGNTECKTCGGTGMEICPSCHGNGETVNVVECPQIVKYYKDIYTLHRSVDICVLELSDKQPNAHIIKSNFYQDDVDVKWFEPYQVLQLCHYHNKGNRLVIDRSQDVIQDICKENKDYKKIVEKFLPHKEQLNDMVCLVENFYLMKDLTRIEITHNIDGEDEEVFLYIHNGNLWFDGYIGEMSNTEKIAKISKFKMKSLFKIKI